eukprot:5834532-Prymnesium_polylepis.2
MKRGSHQDFGILWAKGFSKTTQVVNPVRVDAGILLHLSQRQGCVRGTAARAGEARRSIGKTNDSRMADRLSRHEKASPDAQILQHCGNQDRHGPGDSRILQRAPARPQEDRIKKSAAVGRVRSMKHDGDSRNDSRYKRYRRVGWRRAAWVGGGVGWRGRSVGAIQPDRSAWGRIGGLCRSAYGTEWVCFRYKKYQVFKFLN